MGKESYEWRSSEEGRKREHRFQIFKKLGVKFNDLFLWTERQRNLNYFKKENLPLDFSEIFNIFRTAVVNNSRKFSKKIKTVVISKPVDERSNNFQETIV